MSDRRYYVHVSRLVNISHDFDVLKDAMEKSMDLCSEHRRPTWITKGPNRRGRKWSSSRWCG